MHSELSIATTFFTSLPSFSRADLSLRRLSSSPNLHFSLSGTTSIGKAALIADFPAEAQLSAKNDNLPSKMPKILSKELELST